MKPVRWKTASIVATGRVMRTSPTISDGAKQTDTLARVETQPNKESAFTG